MQAHVVAVRAAFTSHRAALRAALTPRAVFYLALLLACSTPMIAHAQAASGGGSFLSGLVNWLQGSVMTTLATLAVIVVGLTMMTMRASWGSIIIVCIGVYVAMNATTLIGYLQS